MRPPPLPKSGARHLVFLDFLAPRLLAAIAPRVANSLPSPRPRCSSRHLSTRTADRNTANAKASILDLLGRPNDDLSHIATRMSECAKAGDVLGVWSAYHYFRNTSSRFVLGPEHYGSASFMLVKLFGNLTVAELRSEEELHAMEELAFSCAEAGYVDGLRQMMLWLLAKRDAGKVIESYRRFQKTALELHHHGLAKKSRGLSSDSTTDDEELEPGYESMENPDISRLDVANIMAMTMAAHALRDSFHDALHLVLSRNSRRVTNDNLTDLQRELDALTKTDTSALIAKTKAYVEAASTAKLVRRPEVFKAHLRNLSSEKEPVRRLQKVMRSILHGFNDKLPWAAVNESAQSVTRPVVISEKVWAYLIHAFIVARQEKIAEQLWANLLRFGIVPGTVMWNAMLEGYRDTGQIQKLLHAWRTMKREGVPYDAISYGAKIGCLYRERLFQHALKSFEDFKETNPNEEDILLVYNTVLSGLLSRNNVKEAARLLEEMKKDGPGPDIVSYNTFISYYARKVDLRTVSMLVQELRRLDVQPDVFTFTTILTAMLKAGVPNGAERLLSIMDTMGIKQNVATYSAIINAQVRKGTPAGIRTAWELLQQMERMKDVKPNVVTYTSVLAGVHRSRELEKELITTISSDVVQKMQGRGIRLRLGTYHILFKACLENPNPEGLECFMDYYNMAVREGIQFWHDTWYVILYGLIRRDAWALASEMKEQMLKTDFRPMWGVLEMVKFIERWEMGVDR